MAITHRTSDAQLENQLGDRFQLTEDEIKFFLAYVGLEPPSSAPRTPGDAYRAISPHVKSRHWANRAGAAMLARIRAKGALPLLLEYRNLGVNRAITLLTECTKAETIKIVRHGSGVWDYLAMPDYRTRLRAARMLLEVHGMIGPEAQVNVNIDNRLTFGEAVAAQAQERERIQSALGEGASHAQDADYTETE